MMGIIPTLRQTKQPYLTVPINFTIYSMLVNIWLCGSFAQSECLTAYQNIKMQINRNNVKISCIIPRIQQKFSLVNYSLEMFDFPHMIHTIVSLRVNQTQFFMNKIY